MGTKAVSYTHLLSVEDGEAVQVEESELEPPTLEMERPVQTADELEEQTEEEPIQMVEQLSLIHI